MSDEDPTLRDIPSRVSSEDATLPVPSPALQGRPVREFGGYEVMSELGRGGMGIVYRARQVKLNRMVALKMLTGHFGSDELARFVAEAETVAQLHHNNIVHIYEVGETEGTPFFSMEFIEGGTLGERLRAKEFTPREAAELMQPIARAVHFAHEHGIVHRDLKPGNVLLDADGVPKVVDFGIAKRLRDDASLTMSGVIVGTPTYMAPEQAKGSSRDAGPAADVYSLGAILYELLTGRPPFLPQESETALTVRVIMEEPVSPAWHRPDVPRDLEAICMMCLHKDPRDRYASAAAFADDLRRYLNDEPILAKPPTRVRRTVKWVRRHPWRAVRYAAIFMVLGALLFRVWQWEWYERPHAEHGLQMEFNHGNAVPLGTRDATQARRAGVSVKFTRRGREGLIAHAEVLNPRGHPAATRWVSGYDVIPSWLEGVTGASITGGTRRETTSIEFANENGQAVEMTARDRNGRITWRVHFDRQMETSSRAANAVRARFLNYRGYDDTMPSGATHAEMLRDEAGWDTHITFFDSSGARARNGDGVYGYAIERDEKGRGVRLLHLDARDKPMPNRLGWVELAATYTPESLLRELRFLDGNRKAAPWNGIASITSDFDPAGNIIRVTRLGVDGKPVNGTGTPDNRWAVVEHSRNAHGEAEESRYFAAQPDGGLKLLSRTALSYDDNGYVAEFKSFNAAGGLVSRHCYRNDARGNVLEDKSFDEDDDLDSWERYTLDDAGRRTLTEFLDEDGTLESRHVAIYENDRLVSEISENASGHPVPNDDGYTQVEHVYHANGYRRARLFSGYTTKPAVARRETYDEQGRMTDEAWLDEKGQPVLGPDGWALRRLEYNEDGLGKTAEFFLNAQNQPAALAEGHSAIRYRYDPATHVLVEQLLEGYAAGNAFAGKRQRFNAEGWVAEETFLNGAGEPVAGPDGWTTVRRAYDELGQQVEETFFDAKGGKAWAAGGHHRARFEHESGGAMRLINEDHDPARFSFYRFISEPAMDDEGRIRKTVSWYEDVEGHPVPGPEGGTGLVTELDEQGRITVQTHTGCSVADTGAPAWHVERTYGEGNIARKVTRQAQTEDGKPISIVPKGAAHTEETYNELGRSVSTTETGFDESRSGFARREIMFNADGRLESVKHFRSDGTVVPRVRVLITAVVPGTQEKTTELHVGDELVSANDRPVTSAYAFVSGPPFPGGAIEVLRAGRRIRVEGFKAGKVGIYLEDRAAEAP